MAGELTDKVAVVTGGGRGIGKAIAIGLAEAGADVAVIGRAEEPLREAAASIEQAGRRASVVVFDITAIGDIPATFDAIAYELGGLDILVNSAGVQITGPSIEVTEEDWNAVIDANLKALFFCCQAAGRRMLAEGEGKIINLASTFSVAGFPEFTAYCASKGGVLQVTRTLAAEWASRGVNVNAIGPTAVRTELTRELIDSPGFLEAFTPLVPAGRVLEPEEMVGAAVYLASEASKGVHGHLLLVDGGYTAI